MTGLRESLLFLLCATPLFAQNVDELKQKRAAKLEEAWFKRNAWSDDYDAARARAKETGKVIFGYFTRSYAG